MEARAAAQPEGRGAEQAYEAFAPVYDDFTAHYDYELWLGNLLPKLRHHGLRGRRLLDVGCGTGKSFLPMLKRGWDVTACDISAAMLERARAKAGDTVRLSLADMRELPAFGEFDLVWALDDAVNYLLSAEEMEETLSRMRANLAPDGLLMFDVNTLQAYRSFFAEVQEFDRGGRKLVWRGLGSKATPPGAISEARFEIEPGADGITQVEAHVHRQRHFPEAQMLELLETVGLECLGVYGHGFDAVPKQPVEELVHSKVVYIARAD
jgi:SAM-dependent methyltransferase